MKSLFSKKLNTLIANINGNIFENIVGYITAVKLKSVLNDNIQLIQEINRRNAKVARWNFSTNTSLSSMLAGATVNNTVLYEDDVILLSNQTNSSENGLWLIQVGASPIRPEFFSDIETQQSFVWVANLMAGQRERMFAVEVNAGNISVIPYFEDALAGAGGSFRGILMKATTPTIPSKGTVYFLAGEKGVFDKAGNVDVTSSYAVIKYTVGSGWSVVNIPVISEQADWNTSNSNLASFIKNKPVITGQEVLAGTNIDWSGVPILTKTLTESTSLTFSNLIVNKSISLVATGAFALTLPASVKKISGEYDGAKSNLIQFLCVNSVTPEVWCVINQENM